AVDAQTRTQLQTDLLRLWDLGRKTIIFVTHDITEAIALGDRALVLSRQPTHIAAEHPIPIPRPRNVADILALEGFAPVSQRIRAAIQCPNSPHRPERKRRGSRRSGSSSPGACCLLCCCCWPGSSPRGGWGRSSSRRRSTSLRASSASPRAGSSSRT